MATTQAAAAAYPAPIAQEPPAARPEPVARRAALGGLILVLYLIPACVGFWHVLGHIGTDSINSGTGDAALETWSLGWLPWALGHGRDPLLSTLANWPFGINVADNTSVPTLALIGAPVTLLASPVVTLNLWWFLAFPLSAGAGYLLARRFTAWRPAAFAAGLLYGYSPYMVDQGAGHLNLIFVPLPALIFLVAHELLVRQRWRARTSGLLLAALIILQYGISSEILATTALMAALAAVVVALRWPGEVPRRAGHAVRGLVVAAVGSGVVLAFPIWVALAGPQHVTTNGEFDFYNSALLGPLWPGQYLALSTPHLRALAATVGGNPVENGTYLGLPLVALLLVAPVVVRRRPVVRLGALLALVAFVLSLGYQLHVGWPRFDHAVPHLTLPGDVLGHLPVLGAALPVRYALYVALFASLVLAACLDALRLRFAGRHFAGSRSWMAMAAPAVLAVVALVPLVPAWPYANQGPIGTPPFFTSAAVRTLPTGQVALVYPFAMPQSAQPELWQAVAGFRFTLPGGYFVLPRATSYYDPTLTAATLTSLLQGPPPARTPALRQGLLAQLAAWKVQTVLVQPVGDQPVAFFTWLIGRPPDAARGGMVIWRHVGHPAVKA